MVIILVIVEGFSKELLLNSEIWLKYVYKNLWIIYLYGLYNS